MNSNGCILHEDSRIVVIATGLRKSSKNSKTGKMIQIWILNRAQNPVASFYSGEDRNVCMDCEFRAKYLVSDANAKPIDRKCYVNLAKAPLSIWNCYAKGNYARANDLEMFRGRVVRFGAYGEPVLIPFATVKAIAEIAQSWTGYTHQWRNPVYQGYRGFLMASCTRRDYQDAQSLGWRTFTVSSEKIADQIVCPASAERNHVTTCDRCTLCSGTARASRSIQIQPHGASKTAIANANL